MALIQGRDYVEFMDVTNKEYNAFKCYTHFITPSKLKPNSGLIRHYIETLETCFIYVSKNKSMILTDYQKRKNKKIELSLINKLNLNSKGNFKRLPKV